MRRLACLFVIGVLMVACSASAWALASVYDPKNPIIQQTNWPGVAVDELGSPLPGTSDSPSLADLLNSRKIVYGYWINWHTDCFFYSGDTEEFNKFLELYSKVYETPHTLVIHVGPAVTGNIDILNTGTIPFDWKVELASNMEPTTLSGVNVIEFDEGPTKRPAIMHLWLGRNVELRKIVVPAKVTVEDGGEIAKLITEHGKGQTQQ